MGGGVEVVVTEPLWEGKEGFYCSAECVPVLILCNIMRLNPVGLSLEGAAKGGFSTVMTYQSESMILCPEYSKDEEGWRVNGIWQKTRPVPVRIVWEARSRTGYASLSHIYVIYMYLSSPPFSKSREALEPVQATLPRGSTSTGHAPAKYMYVIDMSLSYRPLEKRAGRPLGKQRPNILLMAPPVPDMHQQSTYM